jgi:phosphohistidine phosphatase
MKLYLLQHGEAHSKAQDLNRPLTTTGIADIEHVAEFLKKANIQVKLIIHSGKLRARQTAEYLSKGFIDTIEAESSNSINPSDPPEIFSRQIDSLEGDTLVVSHLPFLPRLISYLLHGDEDHLMLAFQPGSIVCLERVNDKQWMINWMIRPELLG